MPTKKRLHDGAPGTCPIRRWPLFRCLSEAAEIKLLALRRLILNTARTTRGSVRSRRR